MILYLILSTVPQAFLKLNTKTCFHKCIWKSGLDINHQSYHHSRWIIIWPRQEVSKLRMLSFLLEDKDVCCVYCLLRLSALSGESDFLVTLLSYIVLNPTYKSDFHFPLNTSTSLNPQWEQRSKSDYLLLSDFCDVQPNT